MDLLRVVPFFGRKTNEKSKRRGGGKLLVKCVEFAKTTQGKTWSRPRVSAD